MLLKDRPVKSDDGGGSDMIYIRGFPKTESDASVLKLLSKIAPPVETDLSFRTKSGEVWAKYDQVNTACRTIQVLHHKNVNGSILSVKYELGLDDKGKRIVDRSSHTTIIRSVCPRKDGEVQQASKKQRLLLSCVVCRSSGSACANCNCKEKSEPKTGVSYTSTSICVGETEYPFPSGLYLTRVIELTSKLNPPTPTASTATNLLASAPPDRICNPLLALLTDTRSMGNKYAKEISETMAMVDAIQRAISLLPPEYRAIAINTSSSPTTITMPLSSSPLPSTITTPSLSTPASSSTIITAPNRVNVYVLGDGKRPLCAAAACLHLPGHYTFYSVDPLMLPLYSCLKGNTTDTTVETSTSSAYVGNIQPNEYFGVYQNRFFALPLMSQGFTIPTTLNNTPSIDAIDNTTTNTQCLSVVMSCHSHAPLQEFWERLQGPKIAVTMACCAEYAALYTSVSANSTNISSESNSTCGICGKSEDNRAVQFLESIALTSKTKKKHEKDQRIPITPILEFDDYEVYSPKRRVKIFFDL